MRSLAVLLLLGVSAAAQPGAKRARTTRTEEQAVELFRDCSAFELFKLGMCICDETPCFHHISMIHFSKGKNIPDMMNTLLSQITQMCILVETVTPFDTFFDLTLIYKYTASVRAIAETCSSINAVISETPKLNAWEPTSEPYEEVGLFGWWGKGVREDLLDFLSKRLRDSRPYITLTEIVNKTTETQLWATHGHEMRVAVMFIQALHIIDKYVLRWTRNNFELGGWNDDFRDLGVDLSDIFPETTLVPFQIDSVNKRIESVVETVARAIQISEILDQGDGILLRSHNDKVLLSNLVVELERLTANGPKSSEDQQVFTAMSDLAVPNLRAVLRFVNQSNFAHARRMARSLSNFFLFLRPHTGPEQRLGLAQEFFFAFNDEFLYAPMVQERIDMVRLHLPGRNEKELIRKSRALLDASSTQGPLSWGIEVEYSDTDSYGDGVRRDWLEKMINHYFAVDSSGSQRNVNTFWQYTNDAKTHIRPREMKVVASRGGVPAMKSGLRACGRLLGLALKYGSVAGVRLSPASLALLHHPSIDFHATELAAEEDPVFVSSLESLRGLDLRTVLEDEFVVIEGSRVAVTDENLEEYIRQKKFEKAVWSIREEMEIVKAGIHEVLRPGSLNVVTLEELDALIAGPSVLTGEMIVSGISFSEDVGRLRNWLFQVIREMTGDQLRKFLKFVTSSHLPPAGAGRPGFTWLIVIPNPGMSANALPMARTCFRTLYLASYGSKKKLKEKLLYAIDQTMTIEEE